MSFKSFVADLFHLYTEEEYDEVLRENESLKEIIYGKGEKKCRIVPKMKKVKKNIYLVGENKYQVRVQINRRKFQSTLLNSLEEAEKYLSDKMEEINAISIQE